MNDNCKTPFPFKLFQMLEEAHGPRGFSHIVGWHQNGTVFKVHDASAFIKCVAPKYFKQTRYKSFQVCLSLGCLTKASSKISWPRTEMPLLTARPPSCIRFPSASALLVWFRPCDGWSSQRKSIP